MLRKLIFCAVLLSIKSFAANYGMAGCGLGAMVFQDQPGKIQIVAATLNNIISPQTSAISSGTSNCFEESRSEVTLRYIENNKAALKEDVARGKGETVDGLMTMWQCQNRDSISSELKKNYNGIFQSNESNQILHQLRAVPVIQKSCSTIS